MNALGHLLAAAHERFDPYAERILDAARAELAEFGLRRTSLDDIARAAQVGRATLFRRFPGRDALLTALAAREAQAAIARVDAQVADIADPEEFLVEGSVALIHELTANDLLQRLLKTDPEQLLPLFTVEGGPILAMGREYIAGHLSRLRDEGVELTADPQLIGEILARLTVSLALNPESTLPLDDDRQFEQLVRAVAVPMILA